LLLSWSSISSAGDAGRAGRNLAGPERRDPEDARPKSNRFTENFDTADLKDAKALLDELNQ
jgi:hypothetical protein